MNSKSAIEQVLAGRRKPMPAKEIVAAALPLATGLKGSTPEATLSAVLYVEAKKAGGLVVKTGRGEFKLNPKRKASAPTSDVATASGRRANSEARQEARLAEEGS